MDKTKRRKTKKNPVDLWLAHGAVGFLERVGLIQGHAVLDFGCHKGNYTLPAARIVGHQGKVYALDKDKKMLDKLAKSVRRKRMRNVECIHVPEGGKIPIRSHSVDMALLYDVLHRGYLPEAAQRKRVLENIHRVLKPGGILSFYPTHVKMYGLTMEKLICEVRNAGFKLCDESRRKLVHDSKLVRGRILTFRRNIRRA